MQFCIVHHVEEHHVLTYLLTLIIVTQGHMWLIAIININQRENTFLSEEHTAHTSLVVRCLCLFNRCYFSRCSC